MDREITVMVGARRNLFRLLVSILEVEATLEDAGTFTKPWKQRSAWYLAPCNLYRTDSHGPYHPPQKVRFDCEYASQYRLLVAK